jgi:hypothetical protein
VENNVAKCGNLGGVRASTLEKVLLPFVLLGTSQCAQVYVDLLGGIDLPPPCQDGDLRCHPDLLSHMQACRDGSWHDQPCDPDLACTPQDEGVGCQPCLDHYPAADCAQLDCLATGYDQGRGIVEAAWAPDPDCGRLAEFRQTINQEIEDTETAGSTASEEVQCRIRGVGIGMQVELDGIVLGCVSSG